MKVTVTPEGGAELETESVADALEFVRAIRNGLVTPAEHLILSAEMAPVPGMKATVTSKPLSLSPALREVYEFLVDNEQPEGWSPTTLAEAFGVKVATMDQRLRQLKRRGHAYQISRGIWQHGEGA